jgi:hypothetical protein
MYIGSSRNLYSGWRPLEYYLNIYGQGAYKAAYLITARVIPQKCGACGYTRLVDNVIPALLLLDFNVCVCVPAHWPSRVCVEQSEGLRRDGAWEHGVLQQRAAGEAPLEEAAAHVCVLMHVGAAQARTRGR